MNHLARIPQIESLLEDPRIDIWFPRLSRPLVTAMVRESVDAYRTEMISKLEESTKNRGAEPSGPEVRSDIISRIDRRCEELYRSRLRPVINATGVLLHTNLGRSPIGTAVWRDAERINTGYSNLEFDIKDGVRGPRGGLAPKLLARATDSEDASAADDAYDA